MSSTLARIDVRLPGALKEELAEIAKVRGVSLSEMAVSALQTMLEPGAVPPSVETDGMMARLDRLEILLETLIKTYLSLTPPVAEGDKAVAAARGISRWTQFERVMQGRKDKA